MLKISENNGTEEISLVTSTPPLILIKLLDAPVTLIISSFYMVKAMDCMSSGGQCGTNANWVQYTVESGTTVYIY